MQKCCILTFYNESFKNFIRKDLVEQVKSHVIIRLLRLLFLLFLLLLS